MSKAAAAMYYWSLYDVRLNHEADRDDSQEKHGTNGSGDDAAGGPDHEWKEHMGYFRHDMWSSRYPFYCLEAIGWVCDSTHAVTHTHHTVT